MSDLLETLGIPRDGRDPDPGMSRFTPGKTKESQFGDLKNKDSYIQCINVPGTSAQTAGNYGYVVTARTIGLELIGVGEKHEVAGTDAGAVALNVVKVPNGTAISGGTTVLASTFNLKATANTWVYKEGVDLSTARGIRYLKPGESWALLVTGTKTDLAGVHVCLYYRPANNGSYR